LVAAGQNRAVATVRVRDATPDDLAGIAEVAAACGQAEEWAGTDPAYVGYLMDHGRVVVAVRGGLVAGYGATRLIGAGETAAAMLCDLFVDPRAHGGGCGRAMLELLWDGHPRRMTFSSLHGLALPLYTRFGLDAWWPLLYLRGDVGALAVPPGWRVTAAVPDEVGAFEARWSGIDRTDDHRAWAARPGGGSVLASRDGRVLAAGTVGGASQQYGLVHLSAAPSAADDSAEDGRARDAVLAVLASLTPPGGTARAWLPAPHPAVRPLLRSGWRNEEFDLFMSTDPGLLDPRRAVPSPALA
jgi:GNAT superfamily N-acetyltransferase